MLDDDSEESLAIGFPIRRLQTDPLRFHYFEAAGAEIDPGEDIELRFLVTQNGPANGAYLAFTLTAAVPEPGQAGLLCAGLLGAMALGRIWQKRKAQAHPCERREAVNLKIEVGPAERAAPATLEFDRIARSQCLGEVLEPASACRQRFCRTVDNNADTVCGPA